MKIAEMLIDEGLINRNQLNEALKVQRESSEKNIGKILLELKHINISNYAMILNRHISDNMLTKKFTK